MSQLISFIQELKSQLTTLYHQFAPLPAPQEDDEQLREKLNRLYIGASSVTEEPHPSDEGVVSDTPSSPHQPSSGEEASVPTTVEKDTYVCAEVSQDGEGEGKGMEGVTHHAVEGPTATTGNTAGSIVPNDIHVSDIHCNKSCLAWCMNVIQLKYECPLNYQSLGVFLVTTILE